MDDELLARLRELCAEPGPDDGVSRPPRRRSRARRGDRKLYQLCGAVGRAVDLALGACADPDLNACWVVRVEPAPDASRLRVLLQSAEGPDPRVMQAKLRRATPWLRSEVAHAVNRRKTTVLDVVLIP